MGHVTPALARGFCITGFIENREFHFRNSPQSQTQFTPFSHLLSMVICDQVSIVYIIAMLHDYHMRSVWNFAGFVWTSDCETRK